jgi:hypothetical protein
MMSCSIVNCMQLATYAVFVIHTTFTAMSNFSYSEFRMHEPDWVAMNGERVLSIVTWLIDYVHLFSGMFSASLIDKTSYLDKIW